MNLIYLFLAVLLFWSGCHGQRSELPDTMPENVSISYYQGGAMTRSYREFTIEDGVLTYEELRNHQTPKINWTAKIKPTELAELYKAFRANAFDGIENDERDRIVHDAGSETIRISLGGTRSYGVTSGHNSPLSGRNLERYRAVKKALDALLDHHRPQSRNVEHDEADARLTGRWRVAGQSGGHAWFLEWKFEDGRFEQIGYPPLHQEGKYRIAAANGSKLTVELYGQWGNFGEEKRTVAVVLDGADGTISIAGRAGFKRIAD